MSEYVNLAVPVAVYPAALRLVLAHVERPDVEVEVQVDLDSAKVGDANAGESAAAPPSREPTALAVRGAVDQVRAGTEWADEEFEAISKAKYRATDVVSRMMDRLSENAGLATSTSDVGGAIGETPEALRVALGAFSRHLRAHYPGHGWPFSWQRIGRVYEYAMYPATADRWRKVRGLA